MHTVVTLSSSLDWSRPLISEAVVIDISLSVHLSRRVLCREFEIASGFYFWVRNAHHVHGGLSQMSRSSAQSSNLSVYLSILTAALGTATSVTQIRYLSREPVTKREADQFQRTSRREDTDLCGIKSFVICIFAGSTILVDD